MTDFAALVDRRAYRQIAQQLLELERERGRLDLAAVSADPEAALHGHPELEITYDTSPTSGCSVFGYYRQRSGLPSLIVVHPSLTDGRDVFTILHEVGHHVQRQHMAWASYRFGIGGTAGSRLEERIADAIAAELLLPEGLSDLSLDAVRMRDTHDRSRASRAAIAMRAAELASESESAVVVVTDLRGVVTFARACGDDLFPPARGLVQPDLARLISEAAARDGVASGDLQIGVLASSGWAQGEVTATVALDLAGEYAFAVIRPVQRYGRRPEWSLAAAECPNEACGEVFVVDASVEMCRDCGQPKCPECRSCYCEQSVGQVCTDCFMALSLAEQQGVTKHEC